MNDKLKSIIDALSMRELVSLEKYIDQRKLKLANKERRALRSQIRALVDAHGFSSVDEVFDKEVEATTVPKKTRKKYSPKYANPNNPDETWTGQGQQSRWLKPLLAAGATLEDFLINKD